MESTKNYTRIIKRVVCVKVFVFFSEKLYLGIKNYLIHLSIMIRSSSELFVNKIFFDCRSTSYVSFAFVEDTLLF